MVVENPHALAYILPGDVFFLKADREAIAASPQAEMPAEEAIVAPVVVAEIPPIAPVAQAPVQETTVVIPSIPSIQPALTPEVPVTQPTTPIKETPAAGFNYAGGYQKKFLVFVNYPQHKVMEPAHQNALESTLKRKELSLEDIAIFNMGAHPNETLKAIGGFFKPQKMLFLGKDALPAGWNAPAFNQLIKMSKCDVLYTYSFGEMMGNKDNTKAFWEQMKLL